MKDNKVYAGFYTFLAVVLLIGGLISKDYETSKYALIGAVIMALVSFYWLRKIYKKK